jgi:hypothetical protein
LALLAPQAADARRSPPYTSSLDNGVIKVGIDSGRGGAISYLSPSGSTTNYINVYDQGREVQQSYYAGQQLDRRAEGQNRTWSPWRWNPIGAGDSYGNRPVVLSSSITSTTMYVKTQPLLWDMNRELCQCVFETWVTLEGRRVRVHNKLTTFRADNRWNVVTNAQELPAVYPIANLSRVISYTGSRPFTWDATSSIPKSTTWVWSQWRTLESWGACADAGNFGIGVYTPGRTSFLGGLNRNPSGGSTSFDTCYLGPMELVPLDKTSTFEYDYWLIMGRVNQIRWDAYALHQSQPPPPSGFPAGDDQTWNFDAYGDRGGWSPINGIASLSVSGGALRGTSTGPDPYLWSAPIDKPAQDNKVVVRLRNGTPSTRAQIFFTTAQDPRWNATKSNTQRILPNSRFTVYRFDMSRVPGWTGEITRLRLDPAESAGPFAVDWIRIGNF